MTKRCIEPAKGPLRADFRAVASKSATHRALVAAAIADGKSEIVGPLDADDTRRTLTGLRALGVRIEDRGGSWIVDGTGGTIPGGGAIDLGASGTSARFLTALAAVGSAASTLDGVPRLRERPMDELIEAMRSLGAAVETVYGNGLPIRVGGRPVAGGAITVSAARSSQFASALLLIGPVLRHGLRIDVPLPRVSFPYVTLTLEVLAAFGATVERIGEGSFAVPAQRLRATTFKVEGDHSSASYLLAATAILGGRIRFRGLNAASAQPDARFLRDLAGLGCVVRDDRDGTVVVDASGHVPAFAWDLADAPDLAPTAAILALFADGPCRLSGLAHLRLKESDRLATLAENLERMGASVAIGEGTLSIAPPAPGAVRGTPIRAADDHRIAMAFAIAGLAAPGVVLDEPEVVAKSYPGFWDDLSSLVRTGS